MAVLVTFQRNWNVSGVSVNLRQGIMIQALIDGSFKAVCMREEDAWEREARSCLCAYPTTPSGLRRVLEIQSDAKMPSDLPHKVNLIADVDATPPTPLDQLISSAHVPTTQSRPHWLRRKPYSARDRSA
jgi:hypothetical protein